MNIRQLYKSIARSNLVLMIYIVLECFITDNWQTGNSLDGYLFIPFVILGITFLISVVAKLFGEDLDIVIYQMDFNSVLLSLILIFLFEIFFNCQLH